MEFLGFQKQLTEEELENLAAEAYKEVATKSNFYFSIDENKKDKNIKIYNVKAPGNKYRHPSVLLPHEHVHIQHYMESEGMDEEMLFEIYGYYSHLVDLHIS